MGPPVRSPGGVPSSPEVAATFGPRVLLLGEHDADDPDQGVAVGENSYHVGAAAIVLAIFCRRKAVRCSRAQVSVGRSSGDLRVLLLSI